MRFLTTTATTKKAVATTADWLIYAIGGGHGHARRGWLLQRLLAQAGQTAVLLIRPGSDGHLPNDRLPRIQGESLAEPHLRHLLEHPPQGLIADTFPKGWRHELAPGLLARFANRVWLARHSRSHGLADARGFHRLLSPYPADRCEWDGELPGCRHAGYIVDASHLNLHHARDRFVLVDGEGRCNARLLELFRTAARRAGLQFDLQRQLHRPIGAAKLLVVGAGYHSVYECLGSPVDVRFLPIHKRHDDQPGRARRFGRALQSLDALLPWLVAPSCPADLAVRMDGTAILSALPPP